MSASALPEAASTSTRPDASPRGADAGPVPRRAALSDVEAMSALINGFAARGLMLPKSPAELYRLLGEYVVVTGPDEDVVACGGLRVYRPELAEIVGLAVREDWQGRGLGGTIVQRLLSRAEGLGIQQVFAMALDEGFFHRRGFGTIPREWLPEKIAADCGACARRIGCREIAVLRSLGDTEPHGAASNPRRLRVLHARS